MKPKFLFLSFILSTAASFGQSKKEIIENLNYRIDSLNLEIKKRDVTHKKEIISNNKYSENLLSQIRNHENDIQSLKIVIDSIQKINNKISSNNLKLHKEFSTQKDSILKLVDTLNETELEFLREVKKYHKYIEFTKEVTRHYVFEEGERVLYKTTFNYTKSDEMFYFESYIYYDVELSPDFTISYSFSAGRAFSCIGRVFKLDSLIRCEYSFGTGSGTEQIWINEKIVFKKNKDF
jgi:predicted O-linked N-acetylglucosamine transferase (SPINDLY family)